MDHDRYPDDYLLGILRSVKTIAMVGASANEVRPSFFVLKYFHSRGYRLFPINPGLAGKTILGLTVHGRLADVPEPKLDTLLGWMDRDEKITALKTIQGMIWEEGYRAGTLKSVIYPDVAPALRGDAQDAVRSPPQGALRVPFLQRRSLYKAKARVQ